MRLVRSPGVYFEASEQRVPPLALGQSGVPVFIGITRRGPLDNPARITSRARFDEVFGEPLVDGYLGAAIDGFFENGGESCFVLRVARISGQPGEDIARAAQRELVDGVGRLVLSVEAQDPGTWGNLVKVSLTQRDGVSTLLTRDARQGECSVQARSTHGLSAGSCIRLHDREGEMWAYARRVQGKTIHLDRPLTQDFKSAAPTYLTTRVFDLTARDFERDEQFSDLSLRPAHPRFFGRVVNVSSKLIRLSQAESDTEPALSLPVSLEGAMLLGGADGLDDLGPEDFIGEDGGPGHRRGLAGLIEHEQIDLVAAPDLMAAYERSSRFKSLRDVEVVQEALVSHCERNRRHFALLDPPPGGDHEEVLRWRQLFDSAHAALYFPWLVVLEGGERRAVPPSGHIAGVIARSGQEHGLHKAPANEVVEGIVDLQVLLQDTHLARLYETGVNCMRSFGARGLRIWGARTLSSDVEWRHISTRRSVSAIVAAVERGCEWAVFETNDPFLWKRLHRLVASFLTGLREQGMLAGETPEDAFFVQCDHETNPPENVDRGMLVTRIGLAISRPVEFIVFRLVQRLEDQAQSGED